MSYAVSTMTRDLAETRVDELSRLLEPFGRPSVSGEQYLLAEALPSGTPLYGKWDHSLIAYQGNDVVGLALTYERPSGPPPLYTWNEMHLGVLATRDDMQGKGVGSSLLRHLVDQVLNRPTYIYLEGPVDHLGLSVNEDNVGARRLYERFGFQDVEVRNPDTDAAHIMRATLPALAESPGYTSR